MLTAEFLRLKAKECRELIPEAVTPEVIAQLELWAREFEEEADKLEKAAVAEAATVVVITTPRPTGGSG